MGGHHFGCVWPIFLLFTDKSLLLIPEPSQLDEHGNIFESSSPPYLIGKLVARTLFQNLWSTYWDRRIGTMVALWPLIRRKGLVVFIRSVCRQHHLDCQIMTLQRKADEDGASVQMSHYGLHYGRSRGADPAKKSQQTYSSASPLYLCSARAKDEKSVLFHSKL